MLLSLLCVVALWARIICGQDYIVPEPTFEILHPKGFTVSIPDDGEIKLFAFHGNINREILNREAGQFSVDITRPQNGRWTFHDKNTRFKGGDVIYYWLYVIHNDGRGYLREDESYTVAGFCKSGYNCTTTTITNNKKKPLDRPQITPNKQPESETQLQRQVLSEHLELIRLQKEILSNKSCTNPCESLLPIYPIDVRQSDSEASTQKPPAADVFTDVTDQELYRKVLVEQLNLIRLQKERLSKADS